MARRPNSSDDFDNYDPPQPLPAPEPTDLLRQKTPPVPSFPSGFLPAGCQQFASGIALRMQCPLDFVAIPFVIAAATIIGKEFRIAPKARDTSWTERCCLWGGIIGYVGDNKTAAMNAALAPLWKQQASQIEDYHAEFEKWQIRNKRAKVINRAWEKACATALAKNQPLPEYPKDADPGPQPRARQYLTNDTTQEKIAQLIEANPRGTLLFRDELSGWFRTFNQYRPGADEQFYLQCHAGGPWVQNRVRGDIIIPDVYLNILGGFQPGVITEALGKRATVDGMAARFQLLVYPDEHKAFNYVDTQQDRDARDLISTIFDRLAHIDPEQFVGPKRGDNPLYPPFHFTDAAQTIFTNWYVTLQRTIRSDDNRDDPFIGHVAKYPGLFAGLAILIHLLRYAEAGPDRPDPALVDDTTANAIRHFIDSYLIEHARKIYGRLRSPSGFDGARRIAHWLTKNPNINRFTARDIRQKDWSGLTDAKAVDNALDYLENNACWVDREEIPTGLKGGRPTIAYAVNPRARDA
jgi:putative DNA primase/helicase